ncbi:hypothetical protein METBIDRAFT_9544 [Metschnikowia bicuspidata var. bicuspidata NRRL YB-4993]|uniref:SCA7 domain-containing protein n=1 Tax=Metschnikowia bicuspidata var. bicuspidata NRRL YB-4993 TaxID=869754 RepID=A0A1A0HGZ1_9ASCO|nr:hypothetical protein METBIDRAFT_9544 [Metschnikowia bicuspidata var. bicuspidata NRRL YB-4993]OBA23260.1 hypothetical protein METBIDRAFT_9544 [Metschnikowia bicuspidata var. bicuspidata NRRL YB-4993]
MFCDLTPEPISSPPVILSPLRKLHRPGLILENTSSALPPVHSYDGFDAVCNLTPSQILSIQEDQTDYICGVQTNAHVCRNSFYCRRHLLEQRMEVRRSLPLKCLMEEELKNVAWFRKRRVLTKLYHDCKSYWHKHPSASTTPMTCSRTSCVQNESNVSSSPLCASVSSYNAPGTAARIEESTSSLLKKAFLKRLSRSADLHKDDIVSYLFYKLACYEEAGIDMRARELEARYSASENDLDIDQNGQ